MSAKNTKISQVLKELMDKDGLSSAELARRTSIPQSTIHRIMHGSHNRPHKRTLEALCTFFKISADALCGITSYDQGIQITKVPVLTLMQATNWPNTNLSHSETVYTVIDKKIIGQPFALKMPDNSMEPLITKNSLLIIDPEKTPEYRSLVIVKLKNHDEIIVRQLIKDANDCYIRPLSQDFNHFEMVKLTQEDIIKGTVIEARFNCETI